ncbi:MAG: ATP-binding cassette domain-containing protein [Planctomycetota bacterium]
MTTDSNMPASDNTLAVDVRDAVLKRGATTILNGVSLTIGRGEYVALLGANGCGKTSLSRLLLGQLYPTSGRVTVLGRTLGQTDVRELRQHIGVVNPTTDSTPGPGSFHINGAVVDASLSVTEAVCTGYFATVGLYDRPTLEQREHARAILQHVGLGHRLNHRFGVLSTGEQRRGLIARALVHRPELIILDEPTAGLDLAGCEQVLATIDHILRSPNPPAVLMITHHVEELSPLTAKVCLMQKGRIVAEGHADQIITPESLTATFGCKVYVQKRHGRFWLEVLPEALLELVGDRSTND